MNKNILIVVIVLVLVVAGAMWIKGSDKEGMEPTNGNSTNTAVTQIEEYFYTRVEALAVEDIGQPIEGFEPNLLVAAYPGITEDDFEGVESVGGYYTVKNNVAELIHNETNLMTSADQAVTKAGYATLLENLSSRLGMPIATQEDIDALIDFVNTSEHRDAKIDQEASVFGFTVVPLEVIEDSRCPVDVQCIQAGTVRINALLSNDSGEMERELKLDDAVVVEGKTVTLVRVMPIPMAGESIEPMDYIFTFKVEKK